MVRGLDTTFKLYTLLVTCDMSCAFFTNEPDGHWNWRPLYSWNIFENGVNHLYNITFKRQKRKFWHHEMNLWKTGNLVWRHSIYLYRIWYPSCSALLESIGRAPRYKRGNQNPQKKKKDNRINNDIKNICTKNKRSSSTNLIKNQGWTRVHRKDNQFYLH
jgi:hypothetical protein